MNYWAERQAKQEELITTKSIKETEKQLIKYYKHSMEKIVGDFVEVYNDILLDIGEGKSPTPADLYKLDKYWKMQNQLRDELQALGDKTSVLFSKRFMSQYEAIYKSFALDSKPTFSKADKQIANQLINEIWVADGKTWSQRVWRNTSKLQQALNDNLVDCLLAGRKPAELKKELMRQFDVSYHRANTIVRTEMVHVQTQAAKQRYADSGIEKYQISSKPDERTCEICRKMDGKIFYVDQMQSGVNAPPFHPNDRCTIVPVIEGF